MSERYSHQRLLGESPLKRIEVTGGTFDDRWSDIDKSMSSSAKGKLEVDVNAPPGTKVNASGAGLFKDTELRRSTQMPYSDSGPRVGSE